MLFAGVKIGVTELPRQKQPKKKKKNVSLMFLAETKQEQQFGVFNAGNLNFYFFAAEKPPFKGGGCNFKTG